MTNKHNFQHLFLILKKYKKSKYIELKKLRIVFYKRKLFFLIRKCNYLSNKVKLNLLNSILMIDINLFKKPI